jgi:hypothetical protein
LFLFFGGLCFVVEEEGFVRFPELLDTLVRLGHPAHESIFEISNKVFETY